MDKIKSTFANPVEKWRRRNSVEHTNRWVGEHDGYDNRPLPRLTWKGFWMGILVSMGGFVFGYDTGQISGFLSMKDFLRRFGQRRADGTPYFNNVRSGLIVALLSIGTLFGALVAAPIADWIGRKQSIILWCGIFSIGIVVQIAATDKWYEIMMGRFVAGFGVGALSLLVPMYQAETAPRHVRGALISTYQLMITFGIFLAAVFNYAAELHQSENLAQYESLRSRTIKSLTTYLYTIVMEPSTPTSPSPSNIIRLDLTSLTPSPIPTSSPTPILSPTPIQYHESPDEFVQGGITYVKRAIIARKDFRQGTSHIWKYGLQYIRDSDKKEVYYCHECRVGKSKQELFVINGTSRIRNHLEQKHQIDPQSGIKRKGSKESVEKFKELLIRWIVYCHIAFFQLENQYFRELLLFLNPALLNHLPKAAKTIRSWVINAFISKKQQLREDLHHSRSRISISFDLWTSPNPYAILGVVAMWINTTGMRRVTALGMRRIYGEHTRENLGSVVLELLEEYDISGDQIGYFMLDNASANDTAVEFILKDLCPWMKSKQRRHRRLRCLGHVINLCCQAFLMGRNCEKYLAKLEKHHQRGDYTKVEELWKKFGCLGRLHNLVRYIRLTPQRRKEFATIIIGGDLSQFDGLELIQNNSTRWNSWFYSITRALNVRERLELFCNGLGLAKTDLATQCNAVLLLSSHRYIFSARHVPGKGSVGIANFKLDGQHWFELKKIELALKDFYAATLLSEGKKTSLADWFSTLDCLLREISETKDHYHDIQTEDDNNFTWKQEWVLHGDEEKKRWFENAQLAVKHLWETEYKGRYPVEMLPPPARKERDPDPAFDRQREHKRIRIDAPVSTTDLYEQYISTDRLHNEEAGCNEAIAYWLSRYDSQRDLARFALDMFAISPMSDECERLFSSAKLTIVDRRGRLKADIIEACECLRAWYGKPQAEGNSDIEDSENEDY
ncbi:Dimer-Tnp-hAT domain containing protein [Pyrenophora tritici-repentis]|uniref:Dimer-Tnp-hAT domain containing protein n=1 Tax=Pyrenophora tritici-repentis TaxID=45151 RepID=A0A834S0G0_9PLEO|nr:Dimer-Tnp-hAT domain containing protein [Pyrenophora tritici-repentis]